MYFEHVKYIFPKVLDVYLVQRRTKNVHRAAAYICARPLHDVDNPGPMYFGNLFYSLLAKSTLKAPTTSQTPLLHFLHSMVNYLSVPESSMATKVGLGVPLPLLAPATATWAFPFAAYYLFLQNRIVYHRVTSKT